MILTEHLIEKVSQPRDSLVLAAGLQFCHLVIEVHPAFVIFHLMIAINMMKMTSLPQVDFPPPELSTSTRAPLRLLLPVQNVADHYFVCLFFAFFAEHYEDEGNRYCKFLVKSDSDDDVILLRSIQQPLLILQPSLPRLFLPQGKS